MKHLFIYRPCCIASRIYVPWPGFEPVSPALGTQRPNHFPTRAVLKDMFNELLVKLFSWPFSRAVSFLTRYCSSMRWSFLGFGPRLFLLSLHSLLLGSQPVHGYTHHLNMLMRYKFKVHRSLQSHVSNCLSVGSLPVCLLLAVSWASQTEAIRNQTHYSSPLFPSKSLISVDDTPFTPMLKAETPESLFICLYSSFFIYNIPTLVTSAS